MTQVEVDDDDPTRVGSTEAGTYTKVRQEAGDEDAMFALPELQTKTEALLFTSCVARIAEEDAAAFRRAPMILQREIAKRSDVRVLVVDGGGVRTLRPSGLKQQLAGADK